MKLIKKHLLKMNSEHNGKTQALEVQEPEEDNIATEEDAAQEKNADIQNSDGSGVNKKMNFFKALACLFILAAAAGISVLPFLNKSGGTSNTSGTPAPTSDPIEYSCVEDKDMLIDNGFCNGGKFLKEEFQFDGGDCDNCADMPTDKNSGDVTYNIIASDVNNDGKIDLIYGNSKMLIKRFVLNDGGKNVSVQGASYILVSSMAGNTSVLPEVLLQQILIMTDSLISLLGMPIYRSTIMYSSTRAW